MEAAEGVGMGAYVVPDQNFEEQASDVLNRCLCDRMRHREHCAATYQRALYIALSR